MTERVKAVLDSLTEGERQELFTALLRDHFAAGEREVEVHGPEEEIVGYLTSPGVRLAHLLGIDPRNAPPELAGPHYPMGHTIRQLERMAAEAENPTPANP
jgi:hypothetical protein